MRMLDDAMLLIQTRRQRKMKGSSYEQYRKLEYRR
jgi:hypothetical protein